MSRTRSLQDPLQSRLAKLRAYAATANRRAELYSEVSKLDQQNVGNSLSALRKAPAPGKKVQRAGFIMMWLPEPTGVTMAIGAPMILAGRYLDKKYNGATISDIGHNVNSMTSTVNDMKDTLKS